MKLVNKKLISVIIIIALLTNFYTLRPSATESDDSIQYNTIAHHHFTLLSGNIPNNVVGSCSYVAASLLLSFYDSYWNDSFVATKYEGTEANVDSESPYPYGAPQISIENYDWEVCRLLGGVYSDFVNSDENIKKYLHPYLISLGVNLGYHSGTSDDENYGVTLIEQATILDLYFDSVFGVHDYHLTYGETNESNPLSIYVLYENSPGSSRETVLGIINEQITQGNPVIYRGADISGESSGTTGTSEELYVDDGATGHAMIAYNAQESGDVDLHKGHIGDPHTTINTTEYDEYIGVLWIEINTDILPHSCSNNYLWTPSNEYICSCEAYGSIHPEHIHSRFYISNDEATHTYGCEWGCDDMVSPHRYTYISKSNSLHMATCSCGYTMSESHNFERISTRYSVCMNCGYQKDHHLGGNENVHLGTDEEEEKE